MFQLRYLIYYSVFAAIFYNVQTQLENLASNKTTKQSSIIDVYVADRAVDDIIIQKVGYCSHTGWYSKQEWWQVDLSNIYGIESIKIYTRNETRHRLNGFQIIESADGKWGDKQPCYKDDLNGDQPSIVTIEACKGPARYVRISNDKGYDGFRPILELCEVQIYGCPQNKYGNDCRSDCHCEQKGCFYKNGTCFVKGCESGWQGTSCNKTCAENKYGPNCAFTCHCRDGSCNRTNGVCDIPGCEAGWKRDNCSTSCNMDKNEFGFDCNSTCYCHIGKCNNTTGNCNTPGCKAGWKSSSCSTPCDSTKNEFGYGCNATCHCRIGSCNRTTGDCVTPTCKDGWLGTTCSSPCIDNMFGFECNRICHCKEGSCDHTDGHCFKPGCKPGWKGNNCSIQCDDNTFGQNCKGTCFCLNGTCDKITGVCDISGCKPGYRKKTCSVECENGTFGFNCANKCNCSGGTCGNVNGICGILGCKDGSKGSTCSEDSNSKSLPVIVGVLVGSLGFFVAAVLILIYLFRRKRSTKSKKNVNVLQPKPDDALDHVYHELGHSENTEYAIIQTNVNKETTYVNDSLDNTILRMDKIRDDVTEKIKNGTLQEQQKNIPLGPLHPQTAGKLLKNKKKNRNQNILPYDHSRVILNTSNQDPDADYINASYINGLIKDSTYIATQGPLKNTVEDFWRMIWQTNSSVIVMLTNVIEQNQVTCFQYWPVSSSVLGIPGYEITLLEDHMRSEFIIRKLKIENIKTGEVRKMSLLQFTSWPKQSVPHPYQLYLLHQKYAEIISTKNSGPAIIHCRDGSERTGVFIAFDAISHCCYRNETIDICKLVTDMRKNRMNMVATEERYVFLHKLFLEYILFQDTNIPKHDFRTAIKEEGKEEGNNIEREYEVLVNNLPQYDDTFFKEAMLKKNRGKNRNNCILPVETYRLILSKAGASHYINAISVPSCRMSRQFLVTQIPFANTVVDLWNMIIKYNSCTVVSLEDAPSFEKDLIWYPSNENKLDLDKLILTKTSESMAIPGTKEINLNVLDKEKSDGKLIKLYQYLNWRHGSATPAPQTSFLDFIHLVLTWNKSNNNNPITVICSDGARCCGLFCLVYSVIENLSFSDNVDIFQMARLQQIRRPQFFSVEQYHFCYKIVQDYLEKAQLYSEAE